MSPLDRIRWVAAVATAKLPATSYRLAAHLALAAVDGVAWQSRGTLAKAIGCDPARMRLAFRELEQAGFLQRGALSGPRGRQTYRWNLIEPGAESAPGAEVAPGAQSAPQPGAESAPPGGAENASNRGRNPPPKGGSKGGREGGSDVETPPPPIDPLDAAMDAIEARDGQVATVTEGRAVPLPTAISGNVADLAAGFGAVVYNDRDLWEGLIRVYGFASVCEACSAISEGGRSRPWFSKVQEHLSQPSSRNEEDSRPWEERVFPLVVTELGFNGLRATRIRRAVEGWAGKPLNDSADHAGIARLWIRHCTESVDEFIGREWLPERGA